MPVICGNGIRQLWADYSLPLATLFLCSLQRSSNNQLSDLETREALRLSGDLLEGVVKLFKDNSKSSGRLSFQMLCDIGVEECILELQTILYFHAPGLKPSPLGEEL